MLTASFLKSEFNDPGNYEGAPETTKGNNELQATMTRPDADLVLTRKQVVTPDMTSETKWFKSA
jgi:hypothetical protein